MVQEGNNNAASLQFILCFFVPNLHTLVILDNVVFLRVSNETL